MNTSGIHPTYVGQDSRHLAEVIRQMTRVFIHLEGNECSCHDALCRFSKQHCIKFGAIDGFDLNKVLGDDNQTVFLLR